MISLLRESVAVLGRLRWLVLALVIALPLDSVLQGAGWSLNRREQSAFRPTLPAYPARAAPSSFITAWDWELPPRSPRCSC